MKLTKGALKKLIKECVMELLVEGLGNDLVELRESKSAKQNVQSPRPKPADDLNAPPMSMNEVYADAEQTNEENSPHKNAIINSLTDDPVMASIFSDTASTTLTEQARSSRHASPASGGDKMTQLAAKLDPVKLEGSDNWAKLAFDN